MVWKKQISIRRRIILKETPGEEILRYVRLRRQAKLILAVVDPVK